MALTPQEEQQLRELLNKTTPLKDQPVLAPSEFENAILGAVHNDTANGRLRKLGMAILHQALQSANPLGFTTEETVIYSEKNVSAGTDISLDIKSGSTRHSFADGYSFISVERFFNTKGEHRLIPIGVFNLSNNSRRLALVEYSNQNTPVIWHISDTSLRVGGTFSVKITGIQLTVSLETE